MGNFEYLLVWIALPALLLLGLLAAHACKKLGLSLHHLFSPGNSGPHSHTELNRIAMTDALTQLPNRRAFKQQLEAAITRSARQESMLAVAFIDLDDFKPINDAYGHHVGDEVLQIVAKRLGAAMRHCDLVGRIGGDEFLALIEDIKSDQDIVPIVERIIHSLQDAIHINHHEITISVSVGIAVYPKDGDIDRLLISADSAMYHAKGAGKNQFRFYDKEMGIASDRLLEMHQDLKLALKRDEFELYFQPKVDSKSFEITGIEALIRWRHPVKGSILPSVFIHAAERFGLMDRINQWVIEESCRTLHRLRSMGIQVQISINLAAQQFRDPNLVANIVELLNRFDLPHSCLMFEITSLMALNHPEQFNTKMDEFREAGIDIAMDDFGISNSSIAYLKKVRQLKLDREITGKISEDRKSYEMTDALIRLAHALDLTVVAEGIETEAQSRLFRQLNCDMLQGYLFGRPVSGEKLPQLLQQARNAVK
ncbi:putative signaling protein [Methylophilaceae bacterium]|nr:putative signaling protein [Methylophilaceae bacterium]